MTRFLLPFHVALVLTCAVMMVLAWYDGRSDVVVATGVIMTINTSSLFLVVPRDRVRS